MKKHLVAFCLLCLSLAGCASTGTSVTGSTTSAVNSASATAYGACKTFAKVIPAFTNIKPFMTSSEVSYSNAAILTGANFCETKPKDYLAVVTGITDSLEQLALSIALEKTTAMQKITSPTSSSSGVK